MGSAVHNYNTSRITYRQDQDKNELDSQNYIDSSHLIGENPVNSSLLIKYEPYFEDVAENYSYVREFKKNNKKLQKKNSSINNNTKAFIKKKGEFKKRISQIMLSHRNLRSDIGEDLLILDKNFEKPSQRDIEIPMTTNHRKSYFETEQIPDIELPHQDITKTNPYTSLTKREGLYDRHFHKHQLPSILSRLGKPIKNIDSSKAKKNRNLLFFDKSVDTNQDQQLNQIVLAGGYQSND